MPKVPASHLEARRRGILAAAQRCVSRKGVRGTTMRDICRAANLSPGAVYRYFDGKDAILAALAEGRQKQIASFFRRLARRAGENPDGPELAAALAELVKSLGGDAAEEGLRLDLRLWSEALDLPRVQRTLSQGLAAAADDLSQTTRQPLGADAVTGPRLLIALLQGLALQKALDPKIDLDEIADGLIAWAGQGR